MFKIIKLLLCVGCWYMLNTSAFALVGAKIDEFIIIMVPQNPHSCLSCCALLIKSKQNLMRESTEVVKVERKSLKFTICLDKA